MDRVAGNPRIGTLFEPDGIRLLDAFRQALHEQHEVTTRYLPGHPRHDRYPGDDLVRDYVHRIHPASHALKDAETDLKEYIRSWMHRNHTPPAVFEWLCERVQLWEWEPDDLARLDDWLAGESMLADPVAALAGAFPLPTPDLVAHGYLAHGRRAWFRRYTDEIFAELDRLLATPPDPDAAEETAKHESDVALWWEQDAIAEWWGRAIDWPRPFPIGTESIRADLEWLARHPDEQFDWHVSNRTQFGIAGLERFLADSAPFEGDLHAPIVLTGTVGKTTIDAFPIAARDDEDSFHAVADVRFRVAGVSGDPGASAFQENVRRWWAPFAGKTIRAGMGGPVPKVPHDLPSLLERYREERAAGRARNQLEFALELGITDRHLRKLTGRWFDFITRANSED